MRVSQLTPPEPATHGSLGVWRTARRAIPLENPVLMGILNVTPDSFSDGGRYQESGAIESRLHELARDGADIIDIGGESTRPGAVPVTAAEELDRVLPAIDAACDVGLPISVDTTKSEVARAALAAGAEIINDISALRFDRGMAELSAETGSGLVLMHIRGVPRTMQQEVHYDDLLGDIDADLAESVGRALDAGCRRESLVIDPGIGFGKTAEGNLELLGRLDRFSAQRLPIMIGPSRKSFIGKTLGLPVEERVEATLAVCVLGLDRGARIFRVHDVKEARRALDMADLIVKRS